MKPQMWMSAGRFGAFVPCPQTPLDQSHTSNSERTDLLNGGVYISPKTGHARTYNFQWKGTTEEIQRLQNFYDGFYGNGPYFPIDPSANKNLLPPQWAAPHLTLDRWPSLVRGVKPVVTVNAAGAAAGLPSFSTRYNLIGAVPAFSRRTPRVTIPIPPNQTLRLRAWGAVTGNAVLRINLYDRDTDAVTTYNLTPSAAGTGVSLSGPDASLTTALYPASDLFPANTLFPSSGEFTYTGPFYSRAEIYLTKLTTADASITLNGLTAQMNTNLTAWSPGQGTNGLQFDGDGISISTYHSWGSGWKLATASMTEVGSWMA